MRKMRVAAIVVMALVFGLVGTSYADDGFAPKFTVGLSNTKVKGNPDLNFHLEFAEDDEEIGLFTGYLPKGFKVAPDSAIENNEEIGGGDITIAAGPGCHPSSPSDQAKSNMPVSATFEEKDRTDEEADSGVHAVWFLNLEPLNRVRLLVTGSPTAGWKVEGAPTPSDWTCNPLVVDLTINAKSESGVAIVKNPKKPGPKKFMADIASQDSPAIAHFEQIIKIKK
jgi:hypothetical protein